MIDDLEGMGVECCATSREPERVMTSGAVRYEVLIREFLSDPIHPIDSRLERAFPSGLPGGVVEAHTAMCRIAPTTKEELFCCGLLLSFVYARSPERVIEYDLPFPIPDLGRNLPPGKLLLNRAASDGFFGLDSRGILVNAGSLRGRIGCRGLFINTGSMESDIRRHRDGSGLYVDVRKNLVIGSIHLREMGCSLRPYFLSMPETADALSHPPVLAIEGVSSPRECFLFQDDAGEKLLSWMSGIDHLVSSSPVELLEKYSVGPELPHRVAQQELFCMLLKRSGDS